MKIKLTILLLFGALMCNAQVIDVAGTVTDNINSNPISNHKMFVIVSDTSGNQIHYTDSMQTDTYGHYFSNTIYIPPAGMLKIQVFTYDCLLTQHLQTFYCSYDTSIIANFNICNNIQCDADFSYSSNVSNPNLINFTDNSIGNPDSLFVDFGDGNFEVYAGNIVNFSHVYSNSGSYFACLWIMNINTQCYDSICKTIQIYYPPCISGINYNVDVVNSLKYHFYDNSSGSPNEYLWSFDNWSTADSTINTVHIFPGSGVYNVYHKIKNTYTGCIDTDSVTITILDTANTFNFGGQVFTSVYPLDIGRAMLYRKDGFSYNTVDTCYFDTLGFYYFYNIVDGDYLIKIEPDQSSVYYNQYAPTYFSDVLKWSDASDYHLSGNDYTADVNLKELIPASGQGVVNGYVYNFGLVFPNVEVVITDLSGNPIMYTYTDNNGDFSFSGLDYGDYNIFADLTAYTTTVKFISISSSNPLINDVSINLSEFTDIEQNEKPENIVKIFPNPVKDKLNININADKSGEIILEIRNIIGKELFTEKKSITKGVNSISINTNELDEGIYLLSVYYRDNNLIGVRKFVK